jgi:serine/threonine protein kinase/predicted ATPase
MIGKTLGPYHIREEIGHGGMATVYRAYQPSVEREVALKVIHERWSDDESIRNRFRREARLIARLEHPHILPIYDFDGVHDPPYIVMRYLDQGTLRDQLTVSPFPLQNVAVLVTQIAQALDYAHIQGVIHRDIKPSNMLLDRYGNVLVSDFGIARIIGSSQITGTGGIVGTPDYMAPEQARGQTMIDGRADVYALGVILFQLVTGRLPFQADTPLAVLNQHLETPVPDPRAFQPGLSDRTTDVIQQALAKNPDERYHTAGALAKAFAATITDQPPAHSYITQVLFPRFEDGTPTPTMVTQQRTVTVLHIDVTDYAVELEAVTDPEVAGTILKGVWQTSVELITPGAGVVINQRQNSLTAVWGAELAHEGDAERAIQTALEIRRQLLQPKSAVLPIDPASITIGLHTGTALIERGTLPESLKVSGMILTITERLALLGNGGIRISDTTYRQVRGVFEMQPATDLQVRGRPNLPTYQVLGPRPRAFRGRRFVVAGRETQLIGREAELHSLENAFLTVVEEHETQILTIIGAAGLGKSRVLDAFLEWIDLRTETCWFFEAQATESDRNRPYALLQQILSRRCEILPNDDPDLVRQKLEDGIALLLGSPDAEAAQRIGYMAGFNLADAPHVRILLDSPAQLANVAQQHFRALFQRTSAQTPILVVIDDAHLADEPSMTLLNTLAQDPNQQLLLVATARPEFSERHPGWGGEGRVHRRLALAPFDRRTARELVDALLAPVVNPDRAIRDWIVDRSDGNPLFMEELLRTLLDERVLLIEGDHWRLELPRLSRFKVPTTLYGILQSRIDALLIPEQLVLQRASVIGLTFSEAGIRALEDPSATHPLDPALPLQSLVRSGLLERRVVARSSDAPQYAFSQTLLRDLLYEGLLERHRRANHRAYADWLVSGTEADELAPVIAEHYERAGERMPAVRAYLKAAERSRQIYAIVMARTYYEHALELLQQEPSPTPEHITAYEGLSWLHTQAAMMTEAIESLNHMRTYAATLGDHSRGADACYRLAVLYNERLELDEAERCARRSIDLAQTAADQRELASGYAVLSLVAIRRGNVTEGVELAEQAVDIARVAGDLVAISYAQTILGVNCMGQGAYQRAMEIMQQALAACYEANRMHNVVANLNNLGALATDLGDYDAAIGYQKEALQVSTTIGYETGALYSRIALVRAFNCTKRYIEAEQTGRLGIATCIERDFQIFLHGFYAELAIALLRQGQLHSAIEAANEAVRLAHQRTADELGFALTVQAIVEANSSDPDRADAHFVEAIRLMREFFEANPVIELAQTLRVYSDYVYRQGDAGRAAQLWIEASTIVEQLQLPLEVLQRGAGRWSITGENLVENH